MGFVELLDAFTHMQAQTQTQSHSRSDTTPDTTGCI
jgi:hypothetical protein